ncbi:hypothetical protein GUJ93_ZPchr0009g2299 [Zizania palustris]|nr:hypothetical protein GUJ93_ZPchr0009g2299 [Zizania palustris]
MSLAAAGPRDETTTTTCTRTTRPATPAERPAGSLAARVHRATGRHHVARPQRGKCTPAAACASSGHRHREFIARDRAMGGWAPARGIYRGLAAGRSAEEQAGTTHPPPACAAQRQRQPAASVFSAPARIQHPAACMYSGQLVCARLPSVLPLSDQSRAAGRLRAHATGASYGFTRGFATLTRTW